VAVFTGADSFTNFARVIGDYSSVVTQLCDWTQVADYK
jgi:hypothetical protein